ncbi:MAG: dihydroneopterin aldolase [Candidatus Hydrogenedentes bacterium]|nr:dihydroneopterin aldolase [Candidatus Hydrogenedentota bacterium]
MASDLPLDAIHIRDLHLRCIIGIFPEERREKQDVVINVTMYADLRQASRSDRIEDTVDYKSVKLRIVEMVEKSQFLLVERLAEEIAGLCLQAPLVRRVTVTVDKPAALRFARSVAVEITRGRVP